MFFRNKGIVVTQKQLQRSGALTRNSIQHFNDFRIINLQESAKKFSKDPQDIAGFVDEVKEEVLRFALDFIGEVFTSCNDVLRESLVRQQKCYVVRTDKKNLTTSIGDGHLCHLIPTVNLRRHFFK